MPNHNARTEGGRHNRVLAAEEFRFDLLIEILSCIIEYHDKLVGCAKLSFDQLLRLETKTGHRVFAPDPHQAIRRVVKLRPSVQRSMSKRQYH